MPIPELACSACGASIGHGAQFCPGCGLRLTAEAKPVRYITTRRFPWSLVLLGLVAAMVLIMYIGSVTTGK